MNENAQPAGVLFAERCLRYNERQVTWPERSAEIFFAGLSAPSKGAIRGKIELL